MYKEIRKILSTSCLSADNNGCEYGGNCYEHENAKIEELISEHDKQIRADAIEEMANVLINGGLNLYDDEIRDIWEIAEQLKEQMQKRGAENE